MTHLKPVNRKAVRVEKATEQPDVVALQRTGLPQTPHFPIGCSLVFSPGWEADRTGGTAALRHPGATDPFYCPLRRHSPAPVAGHVNTPPDLPPQSSPPPQRRRQDDLTSS